MSPREQLTCTEIKIASMVWRGFTNPQIAATVGTTEQVIKNHLRSIFDKLGVWSRLELALYVSAHGGVRWQERFETQAMHENQSVELTRAVGAS